MATNARPLALITGASSGIGLELAKVFASHGYDLVLVSNNRRKLERAADATRRVAPDARVEIIQADLADAEGPREVYREARERRLEVEALVNNAGVGVWGDFHQTSLGDEMRMIQLNATSVVQLTKLFLNDMLKRGSGKILITASEASLAPLALAAVYGATKAFVYSFAQAVREEAADKGVAVTALLPGPTETEWFARAGAAHTETARGPLADPARVARDGYDALMRDDDHVVTPLKERAMATLLKVAPDHMKVQRFP